jgi:hypothetical protein
MTSFTTALPAARALGLALAAAVLLLVLAPAQRAGAYTKPAGGAYTVQHLFDVTRGGQLALSRDGASVAKLVLVPGERSAAACGSEKVTLLSRPKVRSWRGANGRYAVAVLPGRLFRPLAASFRHGSRTVRGKLMLLWDRDGRIVETAKVELGGACDLQFYARKRR